MPNKLVPEILDNAPLQYAPENELGVVFLFSHIRKRYGIGQIEMIKASFPDCVAYKRVGNKLKKIRIEFEYKSKNFKTHGHLYKGCDWIVCWENNWPDAPKSLEIVELRKEYLKGFNVWIQAQGLSYMDRLVKSKEDNWSVKETSRTGDLILFYFKLPEAKISCIYRIVSFPKQGRAGWKSGMDYFAKIRRVAILKAPVFLEDLKQDRVLRTAGFVRGRIQGKYSVTEYWPYLYRIIVNRNPSLKGVLQRYSPENMG